MIFINSKIKNIYESRLFYFLIFIVSISIPSAGLLYFDGLPFLNTFENIYILALLPITFILFFKFLNNKIIKLFIFLIFFFKIILLFFPLNGINIWQYENYHKFKLNKYIETYDTFWNKDKSFLQQQAWNSKKNFPIDWKFIKNPYAIGPEKEDLEYRLAIINESDLNKLSLNYKINFFLIPKKKFYFKISSEGCSDSNFHIIDVRSQKIIKSIKCNEEIFLDKNFYEIKGYLILSGKKWTLDPKIKYEDHDFISAFKNNIIFNNLNSFVKNIFFYKFFEIISFCYFFTILIFPFVLSFIGLRKIPRAISYIKFLIVFFIIFFFINFIIYKNFNISTFDIYGSSSISLSIIIGLFLFYSFQTKKINNLSLIDYKLLIFVVIAPIILFFFINKHLDDIYAIYPYGLQDDWDVWEYYSRKIVVKNEWLKAGESVFIFRPGIRYIYAIFHIFFGKSFFVFKVVEPWLLIISGYLLTNLLITLKVNRKLVLFFVAIFFTIYFGENIRWLIGRGLSEFYSLFLICSFLYYSVIFKKNLSYQKIILLSFLGTLGVWLREEHIILYAVLIFANFNSSNLTYNDLRDKNFFYIIFKILKNNFSYLSLYWALLLIGFLLLFVRNYYLSGDFGFMHPTVLVDFNPIISLGRILTGSEVVNTWIPRSYSIFLVGGAIISFVSIFGKNTVLIKHNIFLSLSIISIILTHSIVDNTAYSPRFIIHYLSFTILICIFFANEKLSILKNDKNF